MEKTKIKQRKKNSGKLKSIIDVKMIIEKIALQNKNLILIIF